MLRRAGDRHIAGLVVYLLSDAARYHTGTMIPVDGGLSIALR